MLQPTLPADGLNFLIWRSFFWRKKSWPLWVQPLYKYFHLHSTLYPELVYSVAIPISLPFSCARDISSSDSLPKRQISSQLAPKTVVKRLWQCFCSSMHKKYKWLNHTIRCQNKDVSPSRLICKKFNQAKITAKSADFRPMTVVFRYLSTAFLTLLAVATLFGHFTPVSVGRPPHNVLFVDYKEGFRNFQHFYTVRGPN